MRVTVWTQQLDRQLPFAPRSVSSCTLCSWTDPSVRTCTLKHLRPNFCTGDPSGGCTETHNIPCFELFDFTEWKRVSCASFGLTGAAICPAAVYSLTPLVWFVLLFSPRGVFVTVSHWQLDGRANMHDEAHLAAASAAAGRGKAWQRWRPRNQLVRKRPGPAFREVSCQ